MALSRTLLVASFAVAFVVAGTAVAFLVTYDRPIFAASDEDGGPACGGPGMTLGRLGAERNDTGVVGGHRVVTYRLFAPEGSEGGAIHLCTGVGDVSVLPSDGDEVLLRFSISRSDGSTREDVANAKVEAVFSAAGGQLRVVGWHDSERHGKDDPEVDIDLLVPATGAWAVEAATGVGDVHVADLVVGRVVASSGVGDVALDECEATDDVELSSGVGDVAAILGSVGAGSITLTSGVGDVHADLPRRADVGYEATATSGVGRAVVELGPSEAEERSGGPVGGTAYARTEGYDSRPTKVVVLATAGTGDAGVEAR